MPSDAYEYARPGSSYAPGGSTYQSQVPSYYTAAGNPWGPLGSTQQQAAEAPGYGGVKMPKVKDPMVAAKGGGSVFDWIKDQYRQAGMGELGRDVIDIMRDSHSDEETITRLRETDSYKTRFAGNIARQKAGLPMLAEGEYLNLESSYRQTMRAAGLPKGFYDEPQDFAKWIGGDVSVAEVSERAKTAMDLVNSRDPNELKAFQDYYGIKKGDLAAYYLDKSRSLPILQQQAEIAGLGAEALRAGLKSSEAHSAELQAAGIGKEQARGAYGQTAQDQSVIAKLGAIDGAKKGLRTDDIVDARLGLDAKTEKKIRESSKREAARFGGKSGGTAALGRNASGSF